VYSTCIVNAWFSNSYAGAFAKRTCTAARITLNMDYQHGVLNAQLMQQTPVPWHNVVPAEAHATTPASQQHRQQAVVAAGATLCSRQLSPWLPLLW
jgi:hypothetical protein